MSSGVRVATTFLLLVLYLSTALSASAEEVEVSAKARKLFEAGVAFLEDASGPRYEEAYRAFKSAYEESPSPRILGNIALCAMELERDGEAIELYRRYLAEVDDVDPDERKQIRKDIATLEAASGVLDLSVGASGWELVDERVPVKGQPVRNVYGPFDDEDAQLRVRAGRHRLEIRRADGTSNKLSVRVEAGKTKRVEADGETPDDEAPSTTPSTLPIPYVSRPLTLPAMTLAPALRVRAGQIVASDEGVLTVGLDLVDVQLGILDDLQLDVLAVPLEVQPETNYGDATARVTYRFLDEVVELGSALRAGHLLRDDGERRALIEPQILRMLAHAGDMVRVDSGFHLPMVFGGDEPQIGMTVPLDVAVQVVDIFHVGVSTGFGIADFSDAGGNSFIPLAAFTGVVIPLDGRPLLDIGGRFGWPVLVFPGRDRGDRSRHRFFQGSLSFRLFFFL